MVRVCEATYDTAPVEKEGIQVLVSSVEAEFGTNTFCCSLYPLSQKKDYLTPLYECIHSATDGGKRCGDNFSCQEKKFSFELNHVINEN